MTICSKSNKLLLTSVSSVVKYSSSLVFAPLAFFAVNFCYLPARPVVVMPSMIWRWKIA
jgi:hypothetical protein